jgi:hypothetical protein
MKTKSTITFLAAVALILILSVSCETVIDYRGPDAQPKVVIYAVLQPDSLITVLVSESHSVFQMRYQSRQIPDATVRVYRDGDLLETLSYSEPVPVPDYAPMSPYSLYESEGNTPEPGSVYRVEVEVPGLPMAFGEAEVPFPVAATITDTSSADIGNGYRELVVRFRFRDPAGENNYYRFTASGITGYYYGNKNEPFNPFTPVSVQRQELSYGSLSDPLIAPQQEDDIFEMYLQNTYFLFTDELIPGREYSLRLTFAGVYPDTDYYEFLRARFCLNNITRDLYLHLQSYSAHIQTRDNFLAEPVPVYTNVVNGLGVVGAASVACDSLKIGEYPVDGVTYDMWLY